MSVDFTKRAVERIELDVEERRLHTALRSIRTRCNVLAPISSLPFDIMSKIFALVLRAAAWDASVTVSLATVCQHWYHLMLDAPTLWSYIDIDRTGFRQGFLDKSCDATLHLFNRIKHANRTYVSWDGPSPYMEPSHRLSIDLGQFTTRIQELDLMLNSSCIRDLLRSLSVGLPHLTNLRLLNHTTASVLEGEESTEASDIRIFCPLLRSMYLQDVRWPAQSYSNLEALTMRFNSFSTISLDANYTTSVLTQAAHLRSLDVSVVLSWAGDAIPHPIIHFPTFHLPLLRSLTLLGPDTVMRLFNAIDAPLGHLEMNLCDPVDANAISTKAMASAGPTHHCTFSLYISNWQWEVFPKSGDDSCQCLYLLNNSGSWPTNPRALIQATHAVRNFIVSEVVIDFTSYDRWVEAPLVRTDWINFFEALPNLTKLEFDIDLTGLDIAPGTDTQPPVTQQLAGIISSDINLFPKLSEIAVNYCLRSGSPPYSFQVLRSLQEAVDYFGVDWLKGAAQCELRATITLPLLLLDLEGAGTSVSAIERKWEAVIPGVQVRYMAQLPARSRQNPPYMLNIVPDDLIF
ncbi:hypothetical protein PHLCEN_2v3655 [Hermanssonia centrifuga]|uniref:Uncharacterized protein n=1 Tax=Hermanssonia centrifuga TaxID=98765 RepID=A0A2R6QEN6_9APHY|nr:hypothetical protein PHLCEN_2v3655 [Hermanssonia centrifuga]